MTGKARLRRVPPRLPTLPASMVSSNGSHKEGSRQTDALPALAVCGSIVLKPPVYPTQVQVTYNSRGRAYNRGLTDESLSTSVSGTPVASRTSSSRIASASTTTQTSRATGSIHPSSRASSAPRTLSGSSRQPSTSCSATGPVNSSTTSTSRTHR